MKRLIIGFAVALAFVGGALFLPTVYADGNDHSHFKNGVHVQASRMASGTNVFSVANSAGTDVFTVARVGGAIATTSAFAPASILSAGAITATTGAITATAGTFTAGATATAGTLNFPATGVTGATLNSATATTGAAQGFEMKVTGNLVAGETHTEWTDTAGAAVLLDLAGDGDLTVTKDVAAVAGIFSGAVSGTTGTFSGAVSGTTGAYTGDVTITDASGFNGNAGAQFVGIGLGCLDYVVGTNGRTEAATVREDGETAGTWDEVTCAGVPNTCVAVPSINDTSNFKFGTKSQSITTATMVATDTIGMAAFGAEDWEALENVGMWIYSDTTTLGTDFRFQALDDGGVQSFAMEAITVANQWQFVEADISALAGGTGDIVTQLLIECNHAANCNGITFKIDNIYVWDTDDETALNFDILDQPEAVGSAWSFVTADSGAQAHTRTPEVHCDTIAGSATTFVIDPDDNTYISVTDKSASTIELFYHRAAY